MIRFVGRRRGRVLAITSMAREKAADDVVFQHSRLGQLQLLPGEDIRQTDYEIWADELETLMQMSSLSGSLRTQLEARLIGYRATADRYESEPETGEGKQELLQTARHCEDEREAAKAAFHRLQHASTLLQVPIVLGSVTILALSWPVVYASGIATSIGVVLLISTWMTTEHSYE